LYFNKINLLPAIIANFKDIVIDPGSTVDLAALPVGDPIGRIQPSYGFLAGSVDISITYSSVHSQGHQVAVYFKSGGFR